MLNIIIVVLTISYILLAYVLPLASVAAAIYWGYTSYQSGGSLGASIVVAVISAIVMLIVLSYAKRWLKRLMNKVDLGDDDAAGAS